MSLPARGPLCYTCYEHGHYQDSCPRNATQEAAVGHFRVSGPSAAVDLARQRRILVPIMAGPLLSQKPAVAFLDPGADTSCIGWDALMYVTGMTREQLIPHLDPAVFTSVRGVHEGDAPLASDGSLNIPIEVIYSRRDLSLGGVVGVVRGTQVLRIEVVGCSHRSLLLSQASLFFLLARMISWAAQVACCVSLWLKHIFRMSMSLFCALCRAC